MIFFIGFIAFFTSIISLLPQIYKTYKTKSVEDLSFFMIINFTICSISWVVYGIYTNTTSVWSTNIIMAICSFILLTFKIKYKKQC